MKCDICEEEIMDDTNLCSACAAEMQERDDELAALRAECKHLSDLVFQMDALFNVNGAQADDLDFAIIGLRESVNESLELRAENARLRTAFYSFVLAHNSSYERDTLYYVHSDSYDRALDAASGKGEK
jgi:hypothetical protein